MKSYYLTLSAVLFVVPMMLNAAKPPKEGVLYYNSFDKSLKADYAAGQAEPLISKNAKIVPGGRSGSAYLQDGLGSLKVATKGNINPTSGTIAMWVKPLNWNGNDGKFHNFFVVGPVRHGRRTFQLYKVYNSNFMLLARNPEVKGNVSIYESKHFVRWKAGEWHHLAFSWDKGSKECILYVDGEPHKGTYRDDIFPQTIQHIIEGMSFNVVVNAKFWDENNRTLVDELYVFDRPIGNRGVAELMEVGVKQEAPVFTIPQVKKKPVIDGKITPGEYDNFFSTNTFVETGKAGFYARETRVYAGYDSENLYVMFQSRTKGGDQNIEVLAQRTKRDDSIWLDDAVELIITDNNNNTLHYVCNSMNTIYDALNGNTKHNGKYQVANLIEDIWWVSEHKLPFKELGLTPPKPGETWKIHMTRDWKNPFVFASLSDTADFHNKEQTPSWTFGDAQGTGSLHMNMDKIQARQVDMEIAATDKAVEGAIFTIDRSNREVQLKKINVAPGKKAKLFVDINRIDTTKYQNVLGFSMRRSDGQMLQKSQYSMRTYPPITVNSSVLSLSKSFLCTVDLSGFPAAIENIKLDCVYSENGKVVKKWQENNLSGRIIKSKIVPEKYDGKQKYALRITVRNNKNNAVLLEKVYDWKIPETEVWQNSTVGMERVVPKPWTPVKRSGNDISVWDRTYSLQNNGLPAGILGSGKDKLLSSPVKLVFQTSAGDLKFGSFKISEEKYPDAVKFYSEAENADVKARLDGVVEFDGFTFYDLTVTPKKSNVNINKLQIQYSVPENLVNFAQISKAKTGYADLFEKGKIPARLPAVHQILLGNDKRALAFYIDDHRSLYPEHSESVFTTAKTAENMIISFNAVAQPKKLNAPAHYGFGWQAAPVKPIVANWRNLIQNYRGKYGREANLIQVWSWSYWYGFLRPISDNEFLKHMTQLRKLYPKSSIQPYFCQYILSMVSPEYKLYGEEWARVPRMELMEFGPRYPGKSVVACLGPESFRNFWLDTLDKFLDKYPQVNACYWDSIDPGNCENELHGHGWYDSKGKLNTTHDIKSYRDFYKRAYKIIRSKHPDSLITGHASQRRNLPTFSFCDVVYDGEQFVSRASANPDYCYMLNDNYCRAFFGTQFGIVPMFFSAYYNNEKLVENIAPPTNSIYLHSLVYGFIVHSHRMNNRITDEVLGIIRPFGIGDAEYFAPYDERAKSIVRIQSGADIRMGLYRNKNGKLLAAVGSFGEEKNTAVKIFFPGKSPVTEKRSGKVYTPGADGSIIVNVDYHNFVLLEQ